MIAAVGRQEVNGLTLGPRLIEVDLQGIHRTGVRDAVGGGTLVQGGHGAGPYDVVDGQFVAEDHLAVLVDIDERCEVRVIDAEEIEERAVLTEPIRIIGVVHAYLGIAEEEQQTTAEVFFQLCAAAQVGFFTEVHCLLIFCVRDIHCFGVPCSRRQR